MKKIKKHHTHEIEDAVLTASERETSRMSFNFDRRWLMIFWVVVLCVVSGLIGRVFYLSVVKGEYYGFVASGNSLRSVPIIAPRGTIEDKNGEVLADNRPSRSVIVLAQLLPDDEEERKNISDHVSRILDVDVAQVVTVIESAYLSGDDATIEENISHDQAVSLRTHEQNIPAIRIQQTAVRHYTDGEIFAHIIGYEGLIKSDERDEHPDYLLTDRIGKTGLEYHYEKYLHGIHGAEQSLVDSRGRVVKELIDETPQTGHTLALHIDADLQRYLYERLSSELERAQTRRASAIILDPRNGAVRAMVSLPSYDNNIFATGIDVETYNRWITDDDRPLFNRAIGGVYPPGSTVKPMMAIAALTERVISPDRQIESRGGLQLGSFFFGDWRVHGLTDMRRAIAVSSDVYFYTIGGGYGDIVGLGIERMKQYMTLFGFGEKTGIDLPGEVKGLYPDKEWKERVIGERWYVGNTYHASIGQGYITSTALQVANAIASIANGGTLYEPRVVSHIIAPSTGERIDIAPEIKRDKIADEGYIRIAQEGMRQTVTEGTATMLGSLPVSIAGKTGTAQFGTGEQIHSWFVSYAPYDDPEMVMIIMVEDQLSSLSSTTVPVAYDVYQWYYGGREKQSAHTGSIDNAMEEVLHTGE
jgi:penicillin-binding protein 2